MVLCSPVAFRWIVLSKPPPFVLMCQQRQVMAELKKFDLEHVLLMHCSGVNFVELAKQEMPEKLVLCATAAASPLQIDLLANARSFWSARDQMLSSGQMFSLRQSRVMSANAMI